MKRNAAFIASDSSSTRLTLVSVLAAALLCPALASAHSAQQLDTRGCHDDRRRGQYHCHLGEYRGLVFNSKGDMLEQIQSGKTVEEMRSEQGVTVEGEKKKEDDGDGGWLSWLPFVGDSDGDSRDVGGGEVVMPRGIEERLRTLKDLHDKGLISDEEYETKRKDILGEL